jgi:hypothetical protein
LGEKGFFARMVVREDVNGNIYYDNDLSSIESISGRAGDASLTKSGAAAVSADDNSIGRWYRDVKSETASKAVDANGEPLMAHHGTNTGALSTTNSSILYGNPIGAVARNLADDIQEAPGRAAIGAAAGGVLGGLISDEEPGSAKWWRDVATGGLLTHGALAGLRKSGLTGKGGYFERQAFGKLGGWIDTLPLIGRGPAGVRALKREQQAVLARLNRQTGNVGRFLLRHFTPSERAMMSDLIEGRGIRLSRRGNRPFAVDLAQCDVRFNQ